MMNSILFLLTVCVVIGIYLYIKYRYRVYRKRVNRNLHIQPTRILGEKILQDYIISASEGLNNIILEESNSITLKKKVPQAPAPILVPKRGKLKPVVHTEDNIKRREILAIIAGKYMIRDKKILDYLQDRLGEVDPDKWDLDKKLLFCCRHLFGLIENDPMKKILVGQYIATHTDNNEDIFSVYDYIADIANDFSIDINTRMNAVDILLQSNNTKYIKKANRSLESVRQIGDNRRRNQILPPNEDIALQQGLINDINTRQNHRLVKATENVPRTVYEDSQNVHNTGINESVLQLASELVKDHNPAPRILEFDYNLIANMEPEDRQKIEKSLHRIMTDSSTFKYDTNLYVIFQSLLNYIQTLSEPLKTSVNERLVQELQEMSGLCVTGHLTRTLNVIQGFEHVPNKLKLKMSVDDEIYATLKNRYDKIIMDNDELMDDMLTDEKDEVSSSLKRETNKFLPELYSSYSIDRKDDVLQGSLKALNKYLGKNFVIENNLIV